MAIPTDEEMVVSRAIRQAFETEANPGNAVSGPIPHMLQSQGTFNLIRAATMVLEALRAHKAAKADAQEKLEALQKASTKPHSGDLA